MKNFNSFFNSLVAMPKRLAMVLTVLFTVGVGSVWGAALGSGYEKVTNISTLSAGDRVVLYCDANSVGVTGWDREKDAKVAASGWVEYLVESATGGVYLKDENESNYIASPGSSNQFKYGTKAVCTVDANGVLKCNSRLLYANGTYYRMYSSIQSSYKAFYVYKVVTSTPVYNITVSSNDDSWGTANVSGNTITADPADCYQVKSGVDGYTIISGTATVTHDGNSNTLTVAASSDCSIQVNFEKKPVNTYIDNVQGNEEQELCGNHSAPSLTDKAQATIGTCEQLHWHFMGWVTEANKANPTDANIVKAGAPVTADGTTYYAVWAKGEITGGSTAKQYSFDITPSNFNSTSYVANNNEKTSTAKASDGSTLSVKWTSNQVMLQSGAMQWQKSAGYIYNSTDLGTINSVTVTINAGTFTTYYGTSKQPSSSTTVGNGYFQIKVGDATGKTSKVTITFTKTTPGAQTTTYSDYITSCTTQTTITLKPNGGNGDDETYTTEGTSYTLPACPFSRTGYTFVGWAKSSNGEIEHNDKAELTELDGTPVVLYAQWTANSYTVIFNANGGTGEMDNQSFNYDEEKALSANGFTRKGHTFVNWNNEDDGSGDDFDDEQEVKNLSTINRGTYNLYAQWECVTPTISTQPQSATYLRDDAADALSVVAAASDATLTYQWQKSTDNSTWVDITGATEATYEPSTQLVGTTYYRVVVTNSDGNCSATSDVATIAVRSANCKWVETDISDIESGDKVVITMTKGDTYAMSNNRGTQYSPEAIIINVKDGVINEAVATYNQWTINKENSYLTFYADATNRLYGNSADDGLRVGSTNNAKTNHEFFIAGNYLVNNVTSRYVGVNLTKKEWYCYQTNTGNIKDQTLKFYKKECLPIGQYWINYELTDVVCTDNPVKNKISTDDDAVELNFEATGEHNELPTTIIVTNGSTTLTVNTDYTWNNATGVLTLNPSQITDNITISIAAQKRKYTVTFDANGHGTAPAAQSVTAEGTASEPTAPEATGYTFGGWYKEPECTTAFNFATPITGDITLYAKWTLNKYTITFKNYDGTELQRSEVAYGETPSYTGETPTREQTAQYTYTFKDWSPTIAPATQDQVYTAQFDEVTRSYTVTWMVGTTEYTAGTPTNQVEYDKKVTNLPTSPQDDAIGTCANKFIGWCTKSSGSNAENADYYDDLFTKAENSPAITDATTFYAVFATEEAGGGEQTAQVFATSSLGSMNTVTTGYTISAQAEKKTGYYQDGSGTKRFVQVMKSNVSTSMFANTPTSVTITAKLGGGSTNNDLTNSVYAIWLDKDGNELGNAVLITDKITATTGSNFTVNLPIANATSAYGVRVYHQKETGYNVRYYAISLSYKYNNTTYSNYVTNCCELLPVTNLQVSGVTEKSATLTWTKPSSTTDITELQIRNADNDAVVVDDINPTTTTATINELDECIKYNYYVVSVGAECEVSSETVTAQPFGDAKTVHYDYNGGSDSPASFTTSCENQVITLPTATRAGYDFNGWYTATTGGTKVGDAGGTYDPTISSITLYAQWTKIIYIISFHANGGGGTMANQSADENDVVAQLNANQFTRDGYAFVGWNTKANGTGIAYADQATDITLTGNLTLYAQWAAIVTLNDAGNVTTTHPATAGGSITLEDGANACDPYEFVGWTTVATGDWNEGINEPTLVPSPYSPAEPTTLYAVYKIQSEGNANAFKLSFEGGNGKTYYVGSYNSSPYLRGYSNITEEEAVTFIRTKMYPNDDTRYYLHMEHKGEYLYYTGSLNSTSSTPSESQGWVFHTVGDKIKLQSTYSYDPDYLSFSDRDQETINISTSTSGSEFNMLSAVTSTYVAAPLCNQEITITFETGNGDFVANAPTTNPLTKSRGDVITLPTCEYPGYEFMGWMKDEQQLDPSDIIGTYYTGDYTVDGVSSTITFYAYYKVIPEEVEFTGKDDVELLMYYYDGTENYYYASSLDGGNGELPSMQNCFNATTWTFTNVGNMQYHIQDETGKYLGAYSDGDNDLILSATPKVWTFTEVNGLWKMVCENSPSRALMYISTGKTFANSAITNEGNGAYSYITLGICPYPTYTTNPVLSQGFSITNTAMVTSAAGQKVKAANALTLETRNIELPCTFTITAPNITFYDNTGAEVTQLTASAASEQFELYFAYKPTAENTIEYPTVTITDDEMKTYTIKNRIYARSLPATFAIVAKVGNLWYALPSQGLNSTDALVGYPVEVDNQNDPTAVTAVPENADWSLRGVYEASRSDATKDRYVVNGDNLVFVNNASPAMALNASTSGNYLLTDAQYANYYQNNPGLYEWIPTTTDLETYQLTNEQRSRTLSVNTATVFGVHATDKAVEQVRFLPIQNRYIPAALQVVEWKENSVVIMYNGDPAQTVSVSVNGAAAQNTTLSAAQRDIAVYELAATGLAANPTQRLSITIGTETTILSIPYIISGSKNDIDVLPGSTVPARQDVAKVSDLVILKDAMLTAAGSKSDPYKFRNVTIYGGGSLIIPADKGFGANTITMRVGGVENGQYENLYPQLQLKGTLTNTSRQINLDYLTTNDFYYPLSVPYSVTISDIQYPVDIYGTNVTSNNTGSFQFKYYDGAERAAGKTGWIVLDETANPTLNPKTGYAIWGIPKKVKVNGGESTRQKFGIHRLPLKKAANDMMTSEKQPHSATINVYNGSKRDSDNGWNYLGNPYLSHYGDFTTADNVMKLGKLVWDEAQGAWLPTDTEQRYVVFTNDCQNYTAERASTTAIPAFSAFFIQADQGGAINFTSPNVATPQSLAARHSEEETKEITTGIILSGEKHSDRTGLLIADQFTEAYEFNADLSKFDNQDMNLYTISSSGKLAFMAINEDLAKQTIPLGYSVSTDGMYTIAFDEQRYSRNDIYALYLIDYDRNETTNLLHMDYNFYSETGAHAERFALQVAFAPNTSTDVEYTQVGDVLLSREGNTLRLDNLPSDATVTVYDAVGHLIEQHTASQLLQLTLQKGYYLLHIGNNQNSVVIDTFIP